jgi:hypothetical protein
MNRRAFLKGAAKIAAGVLGISAVHKSCAPQKELYIGKAEEKPRRLAEILESDDYDHGPHPGHWADSFYENHNFPTVDIYVSDFGEHRIIRNRLLDTIDEAKLNAKIAQVWEAGGSTDLIVFGEGPWHHITK